MPRGLRRLPARHQRQKTQDTCACLQEMEKIPRPMAPESFLGPSAWRIPILILTECGMDSAKRDGLGGRPGCPSQNPERNNLLHQASRAAG